MSKEDELRDLLDGTAKAISQSYSDPRTWLSWVVYFLGRLELQATDENPVHKNYFRDMLSGLQDVIRNRIKTGGW
jgi:predicted ATP-binding protein involved in virulence